MEIKRKQETTRNSWGKTGRENFYEDAPEYQIIAAGSLLGVTIHPNESFPVGKVDFLELGPMSFGEFLLAIGENGLARILDEKLWDMLPAVTDKFKEHLRYYFYVGGMPKVVAHFSQHRDWNTVRKLQNKILKTYQSDFSKHAPNDILPLINMVWNSIPAQIRNCQLSNFFSTIRDYSALCRSSMQKHCSMVTLFLRNLKAHYQNSMYFSILCEIKRWQFIILHLKTANMKSTL